MVDPTELSTGDEVEVEIETVYQPKDADPDTGVLTVTHVSEADDGTVTVTFEKYHENGYPTRRAVFPGEDAEDDDPVYERTRGDPTDGVWCKFSRRFEMRWTRCGYEKDDGTECGLCAGWGTDHKGRGRCKHHESIADQPNVTVGDGVRAVVAD